MKYTILFVVGFLLLGCSSKVHPCFESNRYIADVSHHIVNDSLKMYHKSLGDFDYIEDKKQLQKVLNKLKLDKVLVYGKTNLAPYYEYFLLLNPRRKVNFSDFEHVLDTTLANDRYVFLGRGLNDKFPEPDFEHITGSLIAGDNYRKEVVPLNEILKRYTNSSRFLKAYTEISKYPAIDQAEEWFKLQFELTFLSMLGKNPTYEAKLAKSEANYPISEKAVLQIQESGFHGKQAVEKEILSITKEARLVMFNENHFYPNHRILLTNLLPELKKQGYKYLAIEALYNDSLINAGERANLETGFYTKEQQFYHLISTAQDLGFTFVAYDSFGKSREATQASNIHSKTFASDKNAKVIVYGGIDHISESPDKRGKKWMAQLFYEEYGINPITFSQTVLNNYRKHLDGELSLIESGKIECRKCKQVDYHVINNLSGNKSGNFNYKNKEQETVQVAIFDNTGWKSNRSYWNQIPQYSALLLPGGKFSTELKHDNYQLIVFNRQGKILINEKIPNS